MGREGGQGGEERRNRGRKGGREGVREGGMWGGWREGRREGGGREGREWWPKSRLLSSESKPWTLCLKNTLVTDSYTVMVFG